MMHKFWGIFAIWMLTALSVQAQEQKILLVSEDEIVEAVRTEFVEQGHGDNIEMEFFGGQTVFNIEGADKAKILVESLKLDEVSNKFWAGVEIFADGKPYAKTMIQGKYYVMGEVFVPAKNINKGEIIKEDMLKTIMVRMNRIKSINLTDKDKLLNKQAKKSLKEGKIVNERDVGQVMLIKKGDIITSVYARKGLQITARVKAMEDGYFDQKIEVMNTKSEKKFYGIVVDADTVEIRGDY